MRYLSIDALTRVLNVVAAVWLTIIAFVILYDVIGRYAFNAPFAGAREIVGNSVVAIVFLQIPLAIRRGAMIRTTLIYDLSGEVGKRIIDALTFVLGVAFFLAVGVGGWDGMVTGFQVREFEGIGAMEIPVWPIRGAAVFMSFLAAIVYLLMLFRVAVHGIETPDRAAS